MKYLFNIVYNVYKDSFRGLTQDVYIFALMMVINRIGTLILPFLTLYTTQELLWSKNQAGTATMWFGVGSLCGALLGGVLTDRVGYYKTMAISLFSATVFFYSLQFLSEFYVVCGVLFLSSLFADLLRPALMTGITFFTTKETQTRAVSLLRMALNFGIALGPAIAGLLIVRYGYQLIFTIDALTCLLAGLYLFAFVKNKEPKKSPEEKENVELDFSPYKDAKFIFFMTCCFLMLVSFFQILFTVPLYMVEELGYTEKHVGYFFAANGGMIFLVEMPIVHYMEQRYNYFKVMKYGAFMIGLAILIFVFPLPSLFTIGFYTFFVSLGEIINFPFIASTTMNRASKSNMGKYMSVNTVMFSLSLIVAPKVGTGIVEMYGYNVLFVVMFFLCIVSILGLQWVGNHFQETNG